MPEDLRRRSCLMIFSLEVPCFVTWDGLRRLRRRDWAHRNFMTFATSIAPVCCPYNKPSSSPS